MRRCNLYLLILVAFIAGIMLGVCEPLADSDWRWSGLLLLPVVWAAQRLRSVTHLQSYRALCLLVALLSAAALGLGLMGHAMQTTLADRLSQPQSVDTVVRVIGISDGVDDNWRQVVEVVEPQAGLPRRWLLYPKFSFDETQRRPSADLRPGELWRVQVKLIPPHGIASPAAFDLEQWLLTEHIGAVGNLQAAQLVAEQGGGLRTGLDQIDRLRLRLRDHLAALDTPARAVLLSLLTGDRALIAPELSQRYQQAGISHLLAISGPHVVLAALLLTWLLTQLLNRYPRLYLRVPRQILLLPVVVVIVLIYGLLAGWGVPVQRTVLMVLLSSGLLLLRRSWPTSHILLTALAICLWLDPLTLYQSGLWLSFVATWLLISLVRYERPAATRGLRIRQTLRQLLHLQTLMFILLIPLTVAFFHQIPLWSIGVNLIAIPLLGLVVVPLTLLALLIWPLWSGLADALWLLAAGLLEQLHALLLWLPLQTLTLAPSAVALMALALAIGIVLLPRGSVPRWLIIPCLLPTLLPLWLPKPLFGSAHDAPLRVQVLDVGQGLAILIQTRHHSMLYDTGAKRAEAQQGMGERVVLPALAAANVRHLDTLLISHPDFEHQGGSGAVLAHLAVDQVVSSRPLLGIPTLPCAAGQHWRWDGVDFSVLAPWPDRPFFDDKDLSCVLRIQTPAPHATTVLLMGDAGSEVEEGLLAEQVADPVGHALTAQLLLLGDHGSERASTPAFLQTVQPQIGVISTSALNKKYPAASTLQSLSQKHIALESTVQGGTLTFDVGGQTSVVTSRYRDGKVWLRRE
jgi:competence protein ComEC